MKINQKEKDMKYNIKMYADFQCPFCYIGKKLLDIIKDKYDIEFIFKSFEIHPDVPLEGIPINDYFELTYDINKQIQDYANQYGISIVDLSLVINSNKSLRVAEYAQEVGKGDAYNDAMYKAIFVDSLNIGLDKVLKKISLSVGISASEVDSVLANSKYKNILKENHYYCSQNEIISVPTFIINDTVKITGAQSPDVFEEIFEKLKDGYFLN